ncbi:hypothetical protein ACS0TY_018623 [Phlomoides rotata]
MGLVWLWSREGKWILLQMNPFLRTALWDFIGTHDYILYSGIYGRTSKPPTPPQGSLEHEKHS